MPPTSHDSGAAAPPIAVFVSGSGRSLANLIERQRDGRLDANVSLVVASRECRGAAIARDAGIETIVHAPSITGTDVKHWLEHAGAKLAVLAGYLRLLPIPDVFADRVINIHPALLLPEGRDEFGGPGMHGRHVHEVVLRSGEPRSGCTVHYADAHYDTGNVILQRSCLIEPTDTPDSLAARVFELELEALPEAINRVLHEQELAR